jgi:hypothetical protein
MGCQRADEFNQLRSQRVRISTPHLRIASIVLANDATRASSNLQDFEKIPGLRIEIGWRRRSRRNDLTIYDSDSERQRRIVRPDRR